MAFREVPRWSWCPVLNMPIKDSEGHSPGAQMICRGMPHMVLFVDVGTTDHELT